MRSSKRLQSCHVRLDRTSPQLEQAVQKFKDDLCHTLVDQLVASREETEMSTPCRRQSLKTAKELFLAELELLSRAPSCETLDELFRGRYENVVVEIDMLSSSQQEKEIEELIGNIYNYTEVDHSPTTMRLQCCMERVKDEFVSEKVASEVAVAAVTPQTSMFKVALYTTDEVDYLWENADV